MPFYFRKSKSLGPLRLNLGKGGIGVSVGVKGARVGTGPRGSYVHVGRGGVYYRKSLKGSPRGKKQSAPPQHLTSDDSKLIDSLAASSHSELTEKLQRAARPKIRWIYLIGALLAAFLLNLNELIVAIILAASLANFLFQQFSRVTVNYDLDPEGLERQEGLLYLVNELSLTDKVWVISDE